MIFKRVRSTSAFEEDADCLAIEILQWVAKNYNGIILEKAMLKLGYVPMENTNDEHDNGYRADKELVGQEDCRGKAPQSQV